MSGSNKSLDMSSLRNKISSKLDKNTTKKNNKNSKKDAKKDSIKEVKDDSKSKIKEATKKESNEETELLRREALSLGASAKDLELIEDLAEDDDVSELEFNDEAGADDDKDFKNDFNELLKNIGLNKGAIPDVIPDEEAETENGNEEEEEEEEEEEKQEEEEEEEGTNGGVELQQDEEVEFDEEEGENQDEEENVHSNLSQDSEPETEEKKKNKDLITQIHLVTSDKLLIPSDVVWYQLPLEAEAKQRHDSLSDDQVDKLYQRGKEALESDNTVYYEEFTKNSSQRKFMSQILSDGTLNDKISALTLLIQESPLHNIKSLDTLVSYCGKKSRNSALQSMNALKDLFLNGLLPDRKLKYFKNQNLSMMLNKKTLAIYYFEDYLKRTFFKILEILEKLSHDPIIFVRMQVLTHIFDFITLKPEQEFNLLRLGVNKLGDIDNKVSSKSSYQLLKLQQAHPNMKSVVIDGVVDIALKPTADYHTTYYSVLTLNQTILRRTEDSVANNLVKTYFTLFEKFLIQTDADNKEANDAATKTSKSYENKRKKNFKRGKKGGKSVKNEKTEEDVIDEKNAKLFSAILTGLNRAFPFANMPAQVYESHLDTLFRITHSSNFNTSVQALVLIHQVTSKANLNSDRYFKTLYESLLDPRLVTSSKQGIYLNLLYKSLKQDSEVARVEAFVKRILQICSNWLNIGAVSGMFFLLTQLEKSVPQIRNLFLNTPVDHEYESDSAETDDKKRSKDEYDSRKRDPKYANADKSSLWEIKEFLHHYHPTVQNYAQEFMGQTGEGTKKPDLGLFTLAHFLDRFVYRNAKHKPTTRGSSIMQPLGGAHTGSLLVKASDRMLHEIPANTEDWLSKKTNEIRPDEKFFYQYFSTKETAIKKADKEQKNKDVFDEESDLDDEEVWDALVKSRPDVEGGEEESDVEFSEEDFASMSDDSDDQELPDDMSDDDSEIELDVIEADEDEGEREDEAQADSSSDDGEAEIFAGEGEDEVSSEEEAFYSFADEEPETPSDRKRTREGDEQADSSRSKRNKRKSLKQLPVFASADKYAQYLVSDEE